MKKKVTIPMVSFEKTINDKELSKPVEKIFSEGVARNRKDGSFIFGTLPPQTYPIDNQDERVLNHSQHRKFLPQMPIL
jgi:protocatechuate 3,4-dioxygenase beta subunit